MIGVFRNFTYNFQSIYCNIIILFKVNELCMELLASYPAAEFVRVTLSALSTLASATLIDVPEQVALLLRYLQDDPRLSVKRHILHLLHSLARKGAHLWPQGALNNLIGMCTI